MDNVKTISASQLPADATATFNGVSIDEAYIDPTGRYVVIIEDELYVWNAANKAWDAKMHGTIESFVRCPEVGCYH